MHIPAVEVSASSACWACDVGSIAAANNAQAPALLSMLIARRGCGLRETCKIASYADIAHAHGSVHDFGDISWR